MKTILAHVAVQQARVAGAGNVESKDLLPHEQGSAGETSWFCV